MPTGQLAGTPLGKVDVVAAAVVVVTTGLAVVGGVVATVVAGAGTVACVVTGAGFVVVAVDRSVVEGHVTCGAAVVTVVAWLGDQLVFWLGAAADGVDGAVAAEIGVAAGAVSGAVSAGIAATGTVSVTSSVPIVLPSESTTTTTRVTVCAAGTGAIVGAFVAERPRMSVPPRAAKHTVPIPNVTAAAPAAASASRRSMLHPPFWS